MITGCPSAEPAAGHGAQNRAKPTRVPGMWGLSPDWELFNRNPVKAAQSITPGSSPQWVCLGHVHLPAPTALQSCLCWVSLPHLVRNVGKRKRLENASGMGFGVSLLLNLQPFGGRTKCSLNSAGPPGHKSQSCEGQLRS